MKQIFYSFLLTLAVTLFIPSSVEAKSYSITQDIFELKIQKDGSVEVIEQLTYDFDGSFSWAEMYIPTTKDSRKTPISNFTITTTDGTPITINSAAQGYEDFYANWSYTAKDEQKTFVIRYSIENAVRTYTNVSELYWKIIGPDWDVPHKNIKVGSRIL